MIIFKSKKTFSVYGLVIIFSMFLTAPLEKYVENSFIQFIIFGTLFAFGFAILPRYDFCENSINRKVLWFVKQINFNEIYCIKYLRDKGEDIFKIYLNDNKKYRDIHIDSRYYIDLFKYFEEKGIRYVIKSEILIPQFQEQKELDFFYEQSAKYEYLIKREDKIQKIRKSKS